jgi:hypothetical protein
MKRMLRSSASTTNQNKKIIKNHFSKSALWKHDKDLYSESLIYLIPLSKIRYNASVACMYVRITNSTNM